MTAKKKLGPGRHLSTIKRDRQSKKATAQNRGMRSQIRTAIKQTVRAIEQSDKTAAEQLFRQARSLIDRAIKRRLYHPKTGQRYVSRLHRRLAALAS